LPRTNTGFCPSEATVERIRVGRPVLDQQSLNEMLIPQALQVRLIAADYFTLGGIGAALARRTQQPMSESRQRSATILTPCAGRGAGRARGNETQRLGGAASFPTQGAGRCSFRGRPFGPSWLPICRALCPLPTVDSTPGPIAPNNTCFCPGGGGAARGGQSRMSGSACNRLKCPC